MAIFWKPGIEGAGDDRRALNSIPERGRGARPAGPDDMNWPTLLLAIGLALPGSALAAEINETAQINRDCSANGCPGIGYYCDATKCYPPRDQLKYGPPSTQEPVYTPSYGRSQFIGSTLVGALLDGYSTFSASDKLELNFTAAIKTRLEDAKTRAIKVGEWRKKIKPEATYADANAAWSKLSEPGRVKFSAETGLGEREYTDMVRITTKPPRNSKGKDLSGDAWAAFGTSAIFSDTILKDYLMGIIKDFDQFTIMARALMKTNMDRALASSVYDNTEEHLVAMVARAHNGGNWARSLQGLKNSDAYDYVKRFLGVPRGRNRWRLVLT